MEAVALPIMSSDNRLGQNQLVDECIPLGRLLVGLKSEYYREIMSLKWGCIIYVSQSFYAQAADACITATKLSGTSNQIMQTLRRFTSRSQVSTPFLIYVTDIRDKEIHWVEPHSQP
jgi:hypothetical protein